MRSDNRGAQDAYRKGFADAQKGRPVNRLPIPMVFRSDYMAGYTDGKADRG